MSKKKDAEKKLTYELVDRESKIGKPMYAMLDKLITAFHADELRDARVILAWNLSWKADVDGRQKLGNCKKATDLDRELADYDFVIVLWKEFWTDPTVEDWSRKALLDHELCHAALKYDQDGEPTEDARGRKMYRIRKHDIEEFTGIVARHGCYKRDLEKFAVALRKSKQRTLPLDKGEHDMAEQGTTFTEAVGPVPVGVTDRIKDGTAR